VHLSVVVQNGVLGTVGEVLVNLAPTGKTIRALTLICSG
jgi:hypothetical protein